MENKKMNKPVELTDELLAQIAGGTDCSDGFTTTPTPTAVAEGMELNSELSVDPTCSCGCDKARVVAFAESDWCFVAECTSCKFTTFLVYGSGTYKVLNPVESGSDHSELLRPIDVLR